MNPDQLNDRQLALFREVATAWQELHEEFHTWTGTTGSMIYQAGTKELPNEAGASLEDIEALANAGLVDLSHTSESGHLIFTVTRAGERYSSSSGSAG